MTTDDGSGYDVPDFEYAGRMEDGHHGGGSGPSGHSSWRVITRRSGVVNPRPPAPIHDDEPPKPSPTTKWTPGHTADRTPDYDTEDTTATTEEEITDTTEPSSTEEITWKTPENTWTPPPTQKTPRPKPPPKRSGTELAALYINSSIDWQHPPCKDFYKFVCSKYTGGKSVTEKIEEYTKRTVKSMLFEMEIPLGSQSATEKAAALFLACNRLASRLTNTEVHLLKRFLSNLGLDLSDMPYDVEFDVVDRVASMSLEFGVPVFVKFGLLFSPPDITDYILEMEINEEDESWLRKTHAEDGVLNKEELYHDYLSDYDRSLSTTRVTERIIASEQIMYDFLRQLRRERFTATQTTVEKLGNLTQGSIAKEHWIWMILHYTSKTYRAEDAVMLWDNAPAVVGLLMDSSRLARHDARILIGWTLLRRLLPFALGARLAEAARKWGGGEGFEADFCYELVSNVMAMAVTHQYLKTYIHRDVVTAARHVVTDLMDTLVVNMDKAAWIQEPVRTMAVQKVRNMRLQLSYPEVYNNATLVEKFYAHFPQVGSEFFTPYMTSRRLVTIRTFRGHVNARYRPSYANAFYNFDENTIKIYAGILQLPVFIFEAPTAFNYGSLGQITGHELMHAFDVRGIAYDDKLRPVNFQDTSTMKQYQDKVLCIRAAFERTESSRARTLNDSTDSEGFADFTGLLLAQAAYESLTASEREESLPGIQLTARQLFFVAHCSKWCAPPSDDHRRQPSSRYWAARSRCIVPLQNTREFAEEFQCKPGDFMNPGDRCSFW
ncbi:neprilysin-2-like [Amblyomma americanum]